MGWASTARPPLRSLLSRPGATLLRGRPGDVELLATLPRQAWRRCPSAGLKAEGCPAGLTRLKTLWKERSFLQVSGCRVDDSLEGHILVWRCDGMHS